MSIAVIKSGGKQYKVSVDDTIKIEKLDLEKSKKIEFVDLLAGKKVTATVLDQGKSKKVRVFKYKNKTGYHRTYGHRQPYTMIQINSIS